MGTKTKRKNKKTVQRIQKDCQQRSKKGIEIHITVKGSQIVDKSLNVCILTKREERFIFIFKL